MAFIQSNHLAVGTKVRLTRDVEVMKGTFTKGHEFTVVNYGPRGPDLEDANGERLLEMGLSLDALASV